MKWRRFEEHIIVLGKETVSTHNRRAADRHVPPKPPSTKLKQCNVVKKAESQALLFLVSSTCSIFMYIATTTSMNVLYTAEMVILFFVVIAVVVI